MTSIQKSSYLTPDLNIIAEGGQFAAHWRILQENSLLFEEFYNRKKSQQEKSRCRENKVDSVHLKGISAKLVEKFLRYVYAGSARKQRHLALKEIKDMLKIGIMFGLRDLRHPMSARCLVDLKVNMEEKGFGTASELHQALLRFLFDRTTVYKTKEIAEFVAYEAYKEASLECLLGVLKTVSDTHRTRKEMRLKLLDIVIELFSVSFMDVQRSTNLTNEGARRASPEGTTRRPPIGQRAFRETIAHAGNSGDEQFVSRSLSQLTGRARGGKRKSEVAQREQSTGFEKTLELHWTSEMRKSKPAFSGKDSEICDPDCKKMHKSRRNKMKLEQKQEQTNEKTHNKLPRKAEDDERELYRRGNENPKSGRSHAKRQGSKYRTQNKRTTEEESVGVCAKDERNQEHARSKSVTKAMKITQETVIENEARIIRKRVRKQWTEQKAIPTIICSEEETVGPIEEKHDCGVGTTKILISEEMRMVSPGPGEENQMQMVSNGWDVEEQMRMISSGWDEKEKGRKVSSGWDKEEQTGMVPSGSDKEEKTQISSLGWDKEEQTSMVSSARDEEEKGRKVSSGWDKEEQTGMVPSGSDKKEQTRMASPGWDKEEQTLMVSSAKDKDEQTRKVSSGLDKEEQMGLVLSGLDKEEKTRVASLCWDKEQTLTVSSGWDKEEQTRMALPALDEKREMEMESHGLDQNLSMTVPVPHRERQRIFLTGGIQKNDYFARRVVFEYDPINGVYIKYQAMDTGRFNHGIVQDGRNLHVVGGNSGTFEQLRSAETYSIEHARWSKQATMREARDEFSLAVCGGCLFAIGGYNGIHDLRTVEKFSVEENSWKFVAPMKNYRAGACSVAIDDRYIYVTGGFDGQVYLNSVERYDITTNCWTEIEQMTNKRAYSCLVLHHHNMYALGGFNGHETLSECETYNIQTKTWSPIPRLNTPRLNATAVVFRDNIFIFGGESDSVFLETVECYNTQSETWSFVQRLPQPMAGLRACLYTEERYSRAHKSLS